jgi:hypothetical protein
MNRVAPPPSSPRTNDRIALAGAIAWPSFFAAGVATMVFFALVDPNELFDIAWPHVRLPREVGYTLGFFVFWSATLGASSFTALLLRRAGDDRA